MTVENFDFEDDIKKLFNGKDPGNKVFSVSEVVKLLMDAIIVTSEVAARACGIDDGIYSNRGFMNAFENILMNFASGKSRVSDSCTIELNETEKKAADIMFKDISRNLLLVQALFVEQNKDNNNFSDRGL